jgi:two-component system cell cycle sensor histidine kinase/response regulator CckA
MAEIRTPAPTDRADLARALFEESGDALFLIDPVTSTCVDANPVAVRLSGFSRDELRAMTTTDLFRHEQPAGDSRLRKALRHTDRHLHGLDGFFLRTRSQTELGDDQGWMPVSLTVTRLHLHHPIGLVTARDVRDQRAMLAKVRQLEAEWRRVLAAVSDCLWSAEVSPEGRWEYRFISPVVEAIAGRPPEYFLETPDRWLEIIHPDDRAIVQAAWQELIGGRAEVVYEYRLVLPDGSLRWGRSSVRASVGRNGRRLDGVVSDITDQKAATAALLESEARYRDLVEHAPIAIYEEDFTAVGAWMADLRGRGVTDLRAHLADHPGKLAAVARLIRVRHVNRAAMEQAGAASKAEMFAALPKLFSEHARAGFADKLAAIWDGRDEYEYELRGQRLDGRPVDVIVRSHVPRRDGQLDLAAVIVTCTDITARRQAEEARDRQHVLLQTVLNAIPDRISRKDEAGVYRGCNRSFAEFFGRREDEVIGRTAYDLFPAAEADRVADADARLLAGGPAERMELWLPAVDGRKVLFESLRVPLPGPDGRPAGLLGISRDITARRHMEEQLQQAGKLEAVGQLAGGVAHDFNNLLTAILGNLSLAQTLLPADHPAQEMLAASDQAAWRAAELTRHLLGFARRTTVRLEPEDLNAAVAETLGILRRTIDPRITIDARPAPELSRALADLGQISQVLMNLCLNARDAMPDGGTLTIETTNAEVDAAHARRVAAARAGAFVRLTVADTGHGIAPGIRDRIFEPFFTTKELGKGTGLGLALAHGIVTQHQGWIEVESGPGRGARFEIYLPRIAAAENRGQRTEDRGQRTEGSKASLSSVVCPPSSGLPTILLVDDEPMIRTLGRTILEDKGYRVLLAADGAEAVEVYRRELGRVDLVILDLSMPRLNGRDACRQLIQIDPQVRVLLSSGYAPDTAGAMEEAGVQGFVAKPYRPADLAAAVRTALIQK